MNERPEPFAGPNTSRITTRANGIFAIVMTLLVFNLQAPAPAATNTELDRRLIALWPVMQRRCPKSIGSFVVCISPHCWCVLSGALLDRVLAPAAFFRGQALLRFAFSSKICHNIFFRSKANSKITNQKLLLRRRTSHCRFPKSYRGQAKRDTCQFSIAPLIRSLSSSTTASCP